VGRDGEVYNFDLGETAKGIFLQMRLDRANQIDPVHQIRPCAQMALRIFAPIHVLTLSVMAGRGDEALLRRLARMTRSARSVDGTYLLSLPLPLMRD
jgi:hypothetical protein